MSLCYSFVSYNYIILIACLTFIFTRSMLDTDTDQQTTLENWIAAKIEPTYHVYNLTRTSCSRSRLIKIRSDYRYVYSIGSAFKLHTDSNTWNTARKICAEEDAHLAVINSDAEAEFLKGMVNATGGGSAFIGIHDMFSEGDWVTIFDESLQKTGFDKWATVLGGVQPDNKGGLQNCGVLTIDGKFDDVHCRGRQNFFCEKNVL